ncbi:MAG: hypothetical protein J6V53_04470, partial [Alphaproteobacteria bacterium]|nr:hypothetical protein [Alphaproteobacteria bacterium]
MRKLQLKIFIIFCCCGLVHFLPQKNVNIHIYADPATTPALLQMRDFIKQPDKDYKIANWNRYYRHIHQSKFKNSFFTQTQKFAFNEQSTFFLTLKKLIETNKEKNVHLHLHFNLWHPNVYRFLTTHPLTKNKIKSIHAYEDSSGRFWWDQDNLNIFATSPIKPTFYYWGNEKKLCSGKTPHSKCHNFHQMHEKTNLVRIDFQKIAKTLSETDKQTLFDLTGFDYQKNKKLLDGKKTHFYILGYDWKIPIIGAQLSGLKKICNSPNQEERARARERER